MPFERHTAGALEYYTAPVIEMPHAFTTRLGGVSTGHLESLNLSVRRGDTEENVRENWKRLQNATGLHLERAVYARQIHSNQVHVATSADAQAPWLEPRFECDGFVTNEPGLPVIIFMADCLPVLLCDKEHGVVAAVHCGWRSSVSDILGNAVGKMISLGARPEFISAAIGPGIGKCCFEVGPEVVKAAEDLLKADISDLVRKGEGDRAFLDLKAVNARRLEQLGLDPKRIAISDLCTMCHPDVFWSHRKTNGKRGVQAAIIELSSTLPDKVIL